MNLRSPPKFNYCGLTIVMSNPSRFDIVSLLSATAGYWFNEECLRPEINRYQCDIRLTDDRTPLLPNTKAILLLGQKALHLWTNSSLSLGEVRGTPLYTKEGLPCIVSFLPQDTMDIKDFEGDLNEMANSEYEMSESFTSYEGEKKHGKTSRSNFRFWLREDTKRIKQVLLNEGQFPEDKLKPEYNIYPNSEEVIQVLQNTINCDLLIDLETDDNFNIRCIGFTFDHEKRTDLTRTIYLVPFLDHNYNPAYDIITCCKILRAFCIAFKNNTVIAHNGAQFDFFVLAWRYKIPVGKHLYDTMLAHARCWPTVEKSLGHCMSHLTWQPYHKAEGLHSYMTESQATQLWNYCGKDVYGMLLVKRALDNYAKTISGLPESIEQANKSIYPYLVCSLLGIHYSKEEVEDKMRTNDLQATQYMRIMQILTGKNVAPLISNKACVEYFHNLLGYPAISRSVKTKKPTLNAVNLLKLKLRHKDNVVIDFLLKYRNIIKETGVLKFEPWVLENDSNKES